MNVHTEKKLVVATFAATMTSIFAPPMPAAEVRDPQVIQAWMTTTCPTEMEGTPKTGRSLTAVDGLLGLGVDYVVDRLSKAIADAAAVDKNGKSKTATIPTYLYQFVKPKEIGDINRCLIIASAPSQPVAWCDAGSPFQNTHVCADVQTGDVKTSDVKTSGKIEKALVASLREVSGAPAPHGTGQPILYAEIELLPSNDLTAFIPRLQALLYSAGLNSDDRKFNGLKPRDLSISASAKTPSGEQAFSALQIYLKGVIPSSQLIVRQGAFSPELDKGIAPQWFSVIKSPVIQDTPDASKNGVVPINLSIELREVGDPNVFLQALAAATSKYSTTLDTEIKSKLPGAMAAAEATQKATDLDNSSKYESTLSSAYGALSAFQASCSKLSAGLSNTNNSDAMEKAYALASAQIAVRKLEATSNQGQASFKPDFTQPGARSGDALSLCKK
jgi:hypothetical protein